MKLKLDLHLESKPIISKHSPVLLMGSCFAEYQEQALKELCFPVLSNPFGITYDPQSLAFLLERIAKNRIYEAGDFIHYSGSYFSLEHHGSLEYPSIQEAIDKSNAILEHTRTFIESAGLAVITFGTSIIFEHEKAKVVGNCHRVPSNQFVKRQLNVAETSALVQTIHTELLDINPGIQCVYTVSPIRHVKSGLVQNNLSKAILRTAIHEAGLEEFYFPAFEIFIDELRDYRFSKEDLVHPTKLAQNYIFDRFIDYICSTELIDLLQEVKSYRKLQNHRALRDPEAHKKRVNELKVKLMTKYPFLTL